MPPQQPYQQPATPNNQYDFIMNPNSPQKPGLFNSGRKMLMLALAGAVVLVLLIVIVSAVTKGGGESKDAFVKIEQEQQEMVRVATSQSGQLTDQATKNFVLTCQLSVASDQSQLAALLKKHGISVSAKTLAAGQNPATDTELKNAYDTSTLDATMKTVMVQQLTAYKSNLAGAYNGSKSQSVRTELKTLYNHADLLLTQSQQQ